MLGILSYMAGGMIGCAGVILLYVLKCDGRTQTDEQGPQAAQFSN